MRINLLFIFSAFWTESWKELFNLCCFRNICPTHS